MYMVEKGETVPHFCNYGIKKPGYHCMFNKCDYLGFSYAPCEIAYADDKGEVDICDDSAWAAFGGDMEPDNLSEEERVQCRRLWRDICRKKIGEAYEEYMLKTGFEKYSMDESL